MDLNAFKELNIDGESNICENSLDDIKMSYRNMNILLSGGLDDLRVSVPMHWFLDESEAISYVLHSDTFEQYRKDLVTGLKKYIKSFDIILYRYDNFYEFYNDYLGGYFEKYLSNPIQEIKNLKSESEDQEDDSDEENMIQSYIRYKILNAVQIHRFITYLNVSKLNSKPVVRLENYSDPELSINNDEVIMISTPDEIKEMLHNAANGNGDMPQEVAEKFLTFKTLPLDVFGEANNYFEDESFVEMYTIHFHMVSRKTTEYIVKDGVDGSLREEVKNLLEGRLYG